MTYASSSPAIMLLDAFGQPSGAAGAPRVFSYSSTHASTDVTAVGFFTGCGQGGRPANIGMRVGDVVMNVAPVSTSVPVSGRVTMHSVIASTPNFASTLASSAYNTAYDCSVASAT